MPLVRSASKKAIGENIRREIHAGKDPKQAAAIAYSNQRKYMRKKLSELIELGENIMFGYVHETRDRMKKGRRNRMKRYSSGRSGIRRRAVYDIFSQAN